jgi:subtilase family serine protease
MRLRTTSRALLVAAVAVPVLIATVPGWATQDGATPHGATAAPATSAPAVSPAAVSTIVDACPPAEAPMASCFAKVVRPGPGAAPLADTPTGYGPADIRSAYGLPASGGSGTVVAIVDAFSDPNAESDLAVYRSTYGLPPCTSQSGCLRVVNQTGASAPLPEPDKGWATEIALDLDMVSATCPDCRILLVEATSPNMEDLGTAVDTAVRLGATVVSNSYGSLGEFAGEQTFEPHYNHPGHPIVVSAGDSGYMSSYPAASAYVTSVGGTSLRRSTSGGWTETVWAKTGSGCSAYIPKPVWQTDAHCPTRMMADIAAVADPATGVSVRDTYGSTGWVTAGGTSAGAPIIAAWYARTGVAAQLEYGSAPWRHHGTAGLRDVTSGTNVPGPTALTCGGDYLCQAAPGYDGPTGWGTPTGLTGLTG